VDVTLIGALEDVAARAVPAGDVCGIGGWLARRTPGLGTKRANSVLARWHGRGAGVEAKLAACERFYAERGLPVRFQITPASQPHALYDVLVARGYTPGSPTAVQTCRLEDAVPPPAAVEITSWPTDEWWRTWQTTLGMPDVRRRAVAALFRRLRQPTAFATVHSDGAGVAVGLGVLDGSWLGIFNMATLPVHRGHGAGRTALTALTGWARQRGATRAYLQVEIDNRPALSLYRGAGFRHAYEYVYLSASPPV
jgi:N-acetylglutamate synthase